MWLTLDKDASHVAEEAVKSWNCQNRESDMVMEYVRNLVADLF